MVLKIFQAETTPIWIFFKNSKGKMWDWVQNLPRSQLNQLKSILGY